MAALTTALELNPSLSVASEALQFCHLEMREAAQWNSRVTRLKDSSLVPRQPQLTLKRWLQAIVTRCIRVIRCVLVPQACSRNSSSPKVDAVDAKISSMEEVFRVC